MRKLLTAAALVCVAALSLASPASAGASPPSHSHAFGQSREALARDYAQWLLGDAFNPLFSGECGQKVGGTYFMNSTLDVGVEYDCDIPAGVPIVFEHAAYYAWYPVDGTTDEELDATSKAAFAPDSSWARLDGRQLPLSTTSTGAYDIVSEPGSAYDAIIGLGTGPIRSAVTGNFTLLHPLTPGDHEVEAAVDFTTVGGGLFSVTYHIHVG
jgi:hypothetical protein